MAGKGGMNKMIAILPVWYISSKMDWEDDKLLMNIRMGFFGKAPPTHI
jgi:hypothetical protein